MAFKTCSPQSSPQRRSTATEDNSVHLTRAASRTALRRFIPLHASTHPTPLTHFLISCLLAIYPHHLQQFGEHYIGTSLPPPAPVFYSTDSTSLRKKEKKTAEGAEIKDTLEEMWLGGRDVSPHFLLLMAPFQQQQNNSPSREQTLEISII